MAVTVSSALLSAANSAASGASEGSKNAAFCSAISTGIGSGYRIVARRSSVVVLDMTMSGSLSSSATGLAIPDSYSALNTLLAADIDSGSWSLRVEKASDANVYLHGTLGRSGTDFILSADLDPEAGIALNGLVMLSPSIDAAPSLSEGYVDVLVNDMKLFHDGPCDVLEKINGWGPGAFPAIGKPMPSGWTHALGWFHVMEDSSNISSADAARAWRVSGPYTGNGAPNTRIQCKELQLWYLDTGNVWRLHGRRQQPGSSVYPIDWSLNVPTTASTWRSEATNGGGASIRDLGRGTLEAYTWHSYTSPTPLPAHNALAACFMGRRILDNPGGPDDRASCRMLGACAGDYYMDAWTAGDGPEITGVNVRDMGWGRMKYFTDDWQLFAWYSINTRTEAQIRANPPPFVGLS